MLLCQVDVLEFIHDNEYVHADIKAANLMLGYRDPEKVSPPQIPTNSIQNKDFISHQDDRLDWF